MAKDFQTIFETFPHLDAEGAVIAGPHPLAEKVGKLVTAISGRYRIMVDPVLWPAAKERLSGIAHTAAVEDIPGLTERFIAWCGEFLSVNVDE